MIIALAGRRIDEENADNRRFPLSAAPSVKEKLKKFFLESNVTDLISSGACGADLLAQEVASELGITRTMVLPFPSDLFRKLSVTDRPGEWGKMYDKLILELAHSNRLIILNYKEGDDEVYRKTNVEILNHAEKLSRLQKNEAMALIIWEGKPKDKDDTTVDFKQKATKRSLQIKEIITLST